MVNISQSYSYIERGLGQGQPYPNWFILLVLFLLGKASVPLYYIVVLLQLTLLTPLLIRIIKKKGRLDKIMWYITPVYLLLIYILNISYRMISLYATVFAAWFLFYYFGLNVKLEQDKWFAAAHKYGRAKYIIFALALSVMEAYVLMCITGVRFSLSQVTFSNFLYVFIIILYLLKILAEPKINYDSKMNRLIVSFGDYSYGIFYLHIFVLDIVKRFITISILPLNTLLIWFATSIFTYLIIMFSNKLLKNSETGQAVLEAIAFD